MKSEQFHIDFLFDCIRKIEEYVAGVSKEAFLENQEKQSAVVLQLMLVGETSKKLSEETRSKVDVPWKEIAGFRDMAIHDYTNLNLERIWDTVNKDIPELKAKMLECENTKGGAL